MKVVGVIAQKGGAGKTTVAVHLAVAAAQKGKGKGRGRAPPLRVLLIDTDEQGSARKWWNRRSATNVDLAATRALGQTLKDAEAYDLVVVDTAPRAVAETLATIKLCDFVICPCRTGRLDLDALEDTAKIVKMTTTPAAVVFNAVPTIGKAKLEEAKAEVACLGLDIAPVEIAHRVAYTHALNDGLAVTEFEPYGRASTEMTTLWRFLEERLCLKS